MTWTDTEAAPMGIGPKHVWRDDDGLANATVVGATADEMRRIADLLACLDAGRVPLPKGTTGPARFEVLNSFPDENAAREARLAGRLEDMDPAAWTLFRELCRLRGEKSNVTWRPREVVARLTGLSEAGAAKVFRRLTSTGYIKKVRASHLGRSTEYELTEKACEYLGIWYKPADTQVSASEIHADTPVTNADTHVSPKKKKKDEEARKPSFDQLSEPEPRYPAPRGFDVLRWAWADNKSATKDGRYGLTRKIYVEDLPEYEAWLDRCRHDAESDLIAECDRCDDNGYTWTLEDGTSAPHDHPDAINSAACSHGGAIDTPAPLSREPSDLTELSEIDESEALTRP